MPKINPNAFNPAHHEMPSAAQSHGASAGHTPSGFSTAPTADALLGGLGKRPPKPGSLDPSGAGHASGPGYIRTLQVVSPDSLKQEQRLHQQGIPVSATAIGTGPFKAFQQNKRSGLMLSPDTPMVVGAKKDMGTNALIKDQGYQKVLSQSHTMPHAELSSSTRQTLEKHHALDADDDEIKRPHVFENRTSVLS